MALNRGVPVKRVTLYIELIFVATGGRGNFGTVKCEKQELFIGLLLFQTNYPFLLQISHVRELHIFWRNFFCLKNWGLVIFLTNVKSVTGVLCGRWPFFCSVLFPRSLYLCRSLTIRKITQLKGADGMKKKFCPVK